MTERHIEKITEVTDQEWAECNEWNRDITEEFLQQGHLSPQTLKQYESALKIFFRWVKDNCKNKPLYELKPRDALKYQNFLISRDLSSSAIKFKRSAVSSLCGYIELYYCDEFPLFRNIYNKKIPNPAKTFVHEKKPLTLEEFNLLIEELEKRQEWQMVAYVKFTYWSGCRKAEARQLLKEVVSYDKVEGKSYYMTHPIRCKGRGKKGKVRRLQFSEDAMEAIKKWLSVRGNDDCPYVFVTKHNGQIKQVGETTFNYWCSDIFSKIVGRRVYPHLIRSTRATHLVINEGKSIDSAKALLGHESTETTTLYVVKDTDEDIDDCF